MANLTTSASYENRAHSPMGNSRYSISPQTLEIGDRALQIAAALAVGYRFPTEMLQGALCGSACRLILPKNISNSDPTNARARGIASILITALATIYTCAASKPHMYAPFFIGFGAACSGYELLRKYIG